MGTIRAVTELMAVEFVVRTFDRTYDLALYCYVVHDLRYMVNCSGVVVILEGILEFRNNMSIFVQS